MSDSGAPASTSAADTASVRGVALGCAKVAVSMTMPAIERGRERPVAGLERDAEAGREQRDHLARRGGVRVDPVGVAAVAVRGMVVDDHPRQRREQLAMALGDRAHAVGGPAVAQTSRSYVSAGSGSVRNRSTPAQERVERRDGVRAHGRRPGAERLEQHAHADHRAQRVGIGVLVADHERVPGAP